MAKFDPIKALKIVGVGLKKSFSKLPMYWVELWCQEVSTPHKPLQYWAVARAWDFMRQGQRVSDRIFTELGPSCNADFLIENLSRVVDQRVERDYQIVNVEHHLEHAYKDPLDASQVRYCLHKAAMSWAHKYSREIVFMTDGDVELLGAPGAKPAQVVSEKQDPKEPPKSPFKKALERRQRKARW